MENRIAGEKKISTRYKQFKKSIMETWESYVFMEFTLQGVEDLVKKDKFPQFKLEHLSNAYNNKDYVRTFNKNTTLGIIDRTLTKINPVRAFLNGVAAMEIFHQDLCKYVYEDFPERLLGKNPESREESSKERAKLLSVIINSTNRREIIDTIIEEKIRSIFYGNPIDFFKKDKANIGFRNYYKDNHHNSMNKLAEIIARRNIYVHNQGKVDNKYLKEVENPQFSIGRVAKLDHDYIRESIYILRGISATSTKLVIENTFGKQCKRTSVVFKNHYSFNKIYNT